MNIEIEHVQFDFFKELSNNIASLQVKSNKLCFALRSGQLYLIDLNTPSIINTFQVPLLKTQANSERILTVWLSPHASNLIIKTNFAKYYFLDTLSFSKPTSNSAPASEQPKGKGLITVRKLVKRNCDVRTVQWINDECVLCGTTQGELFLMKSSPTKPVEPTVSLIFQDSSSIDGIQWVDPGLVLAVADKIMYWHNVPSLLTSSDPLKKLAPTETEIFEKLPRDSTNKFTTLGSSFAWVTNTGIIFGDLTNDTNNDNQTNHNQLSNAKVFLNVELSESNHCIKDIMLTQFHIIILRGPILTIINKLNNKVIFEESIMDASKMLGLAADHQQDTEDSTFWCYSNNNIYEIILNDEANSVWKLLCEQEKFDLALSLKGLNKFQKSDINLYKGEKLLLGLPSERTLAANCLGHSFSLPITSIALKIMNIDHDDDNEEANVTLHTYLMTKLDTLDKTNEVQQIILSTWIVWIFMQRLNELDEKINIEKNINGITNLQKSKKQLIEQLNQFLTDHLDCIDKDTVYQIFHKQNRKQILLDFANLIKDYQYVLKYWIRLENWYESLKVLLYLKDPILVYKYSDVLLINSPDATINTWMKIDNINVIELIPSILNYYTNFQKQNSGIILQNSYHTENYALTYLKWYIKNYYHNDNVNDSIIYNTALYMMIAANGTIVEPLKKLNVDDLSMEETFEQQVIQFLRMYKGNYDTDFILRLSLKFKRVNVSIFLYTQLKLYDDAVTLALDNKMVDAAKLVVNDPTLQDDNKLKKELWLRIAKVLLYQGTDAAAPIDIKETIRSIINESNEVVEIKDLLPLFNEFTTIANLKDELIRSLEKHSSSMLQISEDIKKSIVLKNDIRNEIKTFQQRYQILEPGVSCDSCHKFLQTRKFLVFPCGHCFHTDCLIKAILKSNDYQLKNKIENFQRKMTKEKKKKSINFSNLESIIATKCCLCSDININKIDDPIVVNEEDAAKWDL
ncbi:hypothetical protein NCAS_0C03080 [Naumovozyma castellii]|uniref:Uncharacterized protein n=1 Tax=Naumovozyma castellii TaxID=27288 RepID=G0VCT8_NAUCA|nr:hypothetical protein NCAS_0C03080 [Naumovozyma castellii CBS 4309]CCC69298.1 hypothetical protein NCAS_0C03080 [Naumovozyma castellii CBS 4309]